MFANLPSILPSITRETPQPFHSHNTRSSNLFTLISPPLLPPHASTHNTNPNLSKHSPSSSLTISSPHESQPQTPHSRTTPLLASTTFYILTHSTISFLPNLYTPTTTHGYSHFANISHHAKHPTLTHSKPNTIISSFLVHSPSKTHSRPSPWIDILIPQSFSLPLYNVSYSSSFKEGKPKA